VSRPRGFLAEKDGAEQLRAVTVMIAGSPALVAREQQIFDRYTTSLAGVIAEETGARSDDVEPLIVANALIGVHRALLGYVRRGVIAGRSNQAIARGVRAQAQRALVRFEHGLGDYAV
jgi:hypothetical protein